MSDFGLPEKVQDKIVWIFLLLPGFLSWSIASLIVEFGDMSEFQVIIYSFTLTMINLAVALGLLRVISLITRRRAAPGDFPLPQKTLIALIVPVATVVGVLVGIAAEEDALFRASRWFAFVGLINRESSKRPLAYVLYRNDRADLRREPALDGRAFDE